MISGPKDRRTRASPDGKYNQVWAEVLQVRGGPGMEQPS